MVKPLHIGNAARNGISAAELTALGFTANANIFDQQGGFFGALRNEDTSEELGKRFRFLEPGIAFKAYPCPYSSQRAVDAIVKIVERHNVAPRDVMEITCAAAPATLPVEYDVPVFLWCRTFSTPSAVSCSLSNDCSATSESPLPPV